MIIYYHSGQHYDIQLPSGTWVVKTKTLEKQLRKEERLWINANKTNSLLTFRIRFWPKRPNEQSSPAFREFLYRQIKSDIREQTLQIDNSDEETDLLIKLGALQQRIEFGDTPGDSSLDGNLTPIELNSRVLQEHRCVILSAYNLKSYKHYNK